MGTAERDPKAADDGHPTSWLIAHEERSLREPAADSISRDFARL
jgi:hypothetical protein